MKLEFNWDSSESESIATIGNIYRVRAVQDTHCESPRYWDNVATMVCDHRRYNLGDYESGARDARNAVRASRDYRATWEDSESGQFRFKGETLDCLDLSYGPDLYRAAMMCSDIVTRPLYLFDHSGLSISTGGFSCPWDSGQVGFAFVSLATIRKETKWRTMCAPAIAWAIRHIDGETETYDDYLRGDVYGYICEIATAWESETYYCKTGTREPAPSEWEELGSCWGYYGSDFDKSGLSEQAADIIAHDIQTRPVALDTERGAAIFTILDCVAQLRQLSGAARDAVKAAIVRAARQARLANIARRQVESVA